MIVIDRKDGENIDRLLKRYKRKHRNVQVTRTLRSRKHFVKPSIKRREELLKAAYIQEKYRNNE